MNRDAYNFTLNRKEDLAAEAERAVDTIYGAGLMFRQGQLSPGGNNVMADSAASAFSGSDLQALRAGDKRAALCADIIEMRQSYSASASAAGKAGPQGRLQGVFLQAIYDSAQELKDAGWKPRSEPVRVPRFG